MSCKASAHHIHVLAKPLARSYQASAALLAGAGHSTSDSISVLAIETMSPRPHRLMLGPCVACYRSAEGHRLLPVFVFTPCRTLNIPAVLPYSTAPRELSSCGAAAECLRLTSRGDPFCS